MYEIMIPAAGAILAGAVAIRLAHKAADETQPEETRGQAVQKALGYTTIAAVLLVGTLAWLAVWVVMTEFATQDVTGDGDEWPCAGVVADSGDAAIDDGHSSSNVATETDAPTEVTATATEWPEMTDVTALLNEHGYWLYGRDPVLPRVGESEADVADCRWVAYTDGTNVVRILDNATEKVFGVACDHAGIWEMFFSPMLVPNDFSIAIKIEGKEYRTYKDLMVVLTEFLEYDDCDELAEGETFVRPSYWSEWAKWGVGPTPLGQAF